MAARSQPARAANHAAAVEAIDNNIRAICCRYWGVAPWVLDDMIASGKLLWRHVRGLLRLLGYSDVFAQFWLEEYLDPKAAKEEDLARKTREREESQTMNLVGLFAAFPAKSPEDEEHRKKVMEALAKNGT